MHDPRVLLRLEQASPRLPSFGLSWPRRVAVTGIAHLAVITLLVAAVHAPSRRSSSSSSRALPPQDLPRLVYIAPTTPTIAAGGGGGGNRQPLASGRPAAPPPQRLVPEPSPEPSSPPLELAARSVDTTVSLGAMPTVGDAGDSNARGVGTGGGIGNGEGSGIGSGTGSGIGPGSGGGAGGGVYRPGGGVIAPTLVSQVMPRYTDAALAAHVQGSVLLEVIVRRDGTPDAIRVLRSIERGLDEEAIAAVSQWRFRPGRIGATPVDVLVTCIVDFHIH